MDLVVGSDARSLPVQSSHLHLQQESCQYAGALAGIGLKGVFPKMHCGEYRLQTDTDVIPS